MARSYPIWNKVQACIYNSDKSYGAKNDSNVDIYVGTGASNSHHFINHRTRRIETDEMVMFKFYVDDVKIKELTIQKKNGKLTEETNVKYFNLNPA